MWKIWRNPELVRHLRAQMRPMRTLTVIVVALIVCALVWMWCWGLEQAELDRAHLWATMGLPAHNTQYWAKQANELEAHFAELAASACFKWLLVIQGLILTFWSMAACAQSVLGERDRKTWDFQRTTRLTPGEMVVGKLIGEPLLAYFILLVSMPVSLAAGAMAGISAATLLGIYAVLVANALFLGLGGLWLSTMLESRSRSLFVIGALSLLAFSGLSIPFYLSHFPGVAALSPYMEPGSHLNGFGEPTGLPTIFAHEVSWTTMSLVLYLAFGAWLTLLLVRNIKRDNPDIRPFSRWQSVGFAAFLSFLIYALFRPTLVGLRDARGIVTSRDLAIYATVTNGFILFLVGLSALTPRERLKVWWRQRGTNGAQLFSEDGLPWPWVALSAVATYALMIWGLLAWRHALDFEADSLVTASVMMLAITVFVIRDVLFVQWCMLTRMHQPAMKAFLYLCLYYLAILIIGLEFLTSSSVLGERFLALFTPGGVFDSKVQGLHFPAMVYFGIVLQIGLIALLLTAIDARLRRPAMVPVPAES